jgi:uncharacterized protein (DUF58 family)
LLFICGLNYEANLAMAVAFLLAGMFPVSLLHTYLNLSGVTVVPAGTTPVYAGENAEFRVTFIRGERVIPGTITLRFRDSPATFINLVDKGEQTAGVFFSTTTRGLLKPGPLIVETVFPLGIVRAWSFLDLNIICLVYPKPVPGNRIGVAAALNDGTTGIKPGTSDFYNLREYQKGDSLKQLAWKKYAAGQGVFTKQFVDGSDEHVCLDWNLFTGFGIEDRLSMLCYLVGQYSLKNVKYALHLPNYQSPVGSGAGHRRLLLEKLALYGVACD